MDPVFITGFPRSGTTLVSTLLDNHPDIYVAPKTYSIELLSLDKLFFETLGLSSDCRRGSSKQLLLKSLKRSQHYAHLLRFVESDSNNGSSIRSTLLRCFQQEAKAHNKMIWGDKCPGLMPHLPKLLALFPTAKIVHIIRDGRAVALSWRNRSHADPVIAMQRWKRSILSGRIHGGYLGEKQYLEIHYETLLQEPEKIAHQICAFIGTRYEPAMLYLAQHKDVSSRDSYVASEFDRTRINQWEQTFRPRQLQKLETVGGDLLQSLGYTLVVVKPNGPFKVLSPFAFLMRQQLSLMRALVRRRNMGMQNRRWMTTEKGSILLRARTFFAHSLELWMSNNAVECFRKQKRALPIY